MAATEGCAIAEVNQPAAPSSSTTTVWSSPALRPDIVTAGSAFSSSASSAAPDAWFAATLPYPLIADRFVANGPCIAAARFQE